MKRVCVYRRVSSKQQGRGTDRNDGGWSLPSQEKKAKEYAEAHKLKVVKIFEEVRSASKSGRPIFSAMVAYLGKHPGTQLIAEKMDRLSRNSRDTSTIEELIDGGLVIHLVRDGKQLHAGSSPGERLSSDIEGAVAKHYSRNLGLEVKKGIDARFEAGYFPMGNPPLGYRYPPRRPGERVNIQPEPSTAKIVKRLFHAYTTGEGKSFPEIVELAHKLGYKPKRGGRMSAATAQKLLKNPVYAGWVRHNGDVARGLHKPIITQALFDAAQARMESRPRCGRPNRPRPKLLHAYSGMFSCAHCGGPVSRHMRTRGDGKIFWYCKRWCDGAGYCPVEDIDDQVLDHLESIKLPKARVDKIVRALKKAAKKPDSSIADRIQREKAKRERLIDLYEDGDLTKAQYRSRKAASERQEAALQEQFDKLKDRAEVVINLQAVERQLDLCRDFVELFRRGTPKEQRKILGLLWETTGQKSKLDAKRGRLIPRWRPVWRTLIDSGAYSIND